MSKILAILLAAILLLPIAGIVGAAQTQAITLNDPASQTTPTEVTTVIIGVEEDNLTILAKGIKKGPEAIYTPTSDITVVDVAVIRILVDLDNDFSTGAQARIIKDAPGDNGLPPTSIIPGIDMIIVAWHFEWASATAGGSGSGTKYIAYDAAGTEYRSGLLSGATMPEWIYVVENEGDVTYMINLTGLAAEYEAVTGTTLATVDPTVYIVMAKPGVPVFFGHVNTDYGEAGSVFTRARLIDSIRATDYAVPTLGAVTVDGDTGDWAEINDSYVADAFEATVNEISLDLKGFILAANDTHIALLIENVGPLVNKVLSADDNTQFDWLIEATVTTADGSFLIRITDTIFQVLGSNEEALYTTLFKGDGFWINDNTDTGVVEVVVSKDTLPFTINPGDTLTSVVVKLNKHYVDFLTGDAILVVKNANGTLETYTMRVDGGAYELAAGENTVKAGPFTLKLTTTGPIGVNVSFMDGYLPYPNSTDLVGDYTPASLFFTFNDTAVVEWPVTLVVQTSRTVEEVLYYVKGTGLEPLPTDAYTMSAVVGQTTLYITIDDALYSAGDPLITLLTLPGTVGGAITTSTTPITPLLLLVAGLLGLLIAVRRH